MKRPAGALAREDLAKGVGRFAFAGAATTALYFVLTNAVSYALPVTPFVASFLAYCVCIAVSFVLQSRMVFRHDGDRRSALVKFAVMSLIGLLAAQLIFWIVAEGLGNPTWLASLLVSIAIPIVNFLAMNFWVFVDKTRQH